MIKIIFKNWKTTSAGVVSIVSGVLLFVNDKTKLIEALSAVLAGIGLIFSQDAVK
ncbi:hypothetical protein [Flavobacterium columnare]|uniref:hypothetical protein n=1 Tax=Flavobacterium columnare TaxID=996 RepID=UPI0013742430|nr:hypothetical protein [Flavobacterium columnare]QHJ72937.1 hypothetical protein [Flavobacterium phage fF4]